MKIKAFVIMYNRLTWPKKMCEFLADTGCEVVLIDNASTYPPLLEWLYAGCDCDGSKCPYEVHRMDKNWGHQVFWKTGLFEKFGKGEYIVTDHDLDLTGIPSNYLDVLREGLASEDDITKAGFSLRIDDLPKNAFTDEVVGWEKKFWNMKPNEAGFYKADIDTTFALYDGKRDFGELPPVGYKFHWAVRSPEPYTARHLPWYNTPEFLLSNEEERYYQEHTHTYWSEKYKELI